MDRENEPEKRSEVPGKVHPFPPEGIDLIEYLNLKERAKSYIERAMYLYSQLAFEERESLKKDEFNDASNRCAKLLKSMKWMEAEVANSIVAEYPDLIRQLREKVKCENP